MEDDQLFFREQIEMMEKRYKLIFKKWKISWDKYYEYIKTKLKNRQYWIWCYLCGFEKFIQENDLNVKKKEKIIYQDAEDRIKRIIGKSLMIERYINEL